MKALRLTVITGATAGAVALFLTVAHPGRLAAALATLPATSLLAAAGATMAGVMLGAARWRGLLAAGGTQASVARLFAALTTGAAVNNLVPARGGDAVRVESAHKLTGAGRLEIAGTMVAERILDGFVLAILVAGGALLSGAGGRFVWIGGGLAAAIALGGAVALRKRFAKYRDGLGVALLTTAASGSRTSSCTARSRTASGWDSRSARCCSSSAPATSRWPYRASQPGWAASSSSRSPARTGSASAGRSSRRSCSRCTP